MQIVWSAAHPLCAQSVPRQRGITSSTLRTRSAAYATTTMGLKSMVLIVSPAAQIARFAHPQLSAPPAILNWDIISSPRHLPLVAPAPLLLDFGSMAVSAALVVLCARPAHLQLSVQVA